MALNNYRQLYLSILKKGLLIIAVLILAIFNVVRFFEYIESNPHKIVDYKPKNDEFADYRNPHIAGIYTYRKNGKTAFWLLPPDVKLSFNLPTQLTKKIANVQNFYIVLHDDRQSHEILEINDLETLKTISNSSLEDVSLFLSKEFPMISQNALIYGNISAEKLLDITQPILQDENSLIIWAEQLESNNPTTAIDVIHQLSIGYALKPQLFDLNAKIISKKVATVSPSDDLLVSQQTNLQLFARDYQEIINKLIFQGHIDPETKNKKNNLFDKGASIVLACSEYNQCQDLGTLNPSGSLIRNILKNIQKAKIKFPNSSLKLFLLTEPQQQYPQSEQELLNALSDEDGVIMVNGLRSAMLLPYFHEVYPDRKEFLKQLKIKCGASPDYWSENIKIYFFRTVEVWI